MPELPEVEALRRGLVQRIIGNKILDVEILNEKLVAGKGTTRKANKEKTGEFKSSLKNKKIVSIERRAKNLIFKLDSDEIILVHLKMTGQLVFKPLLTSPLKRGGSAKKTLNIFPQDGVPEVFLRKKRQSFLSNDDTISGGHPIEESETQLPHKHTYIIFKLDNGTLYYNDVRQFGYVLYYPKENILDEEKHFEKIGIEPFDKKFTLKYFKENLKDKTTPIKKLLLDQTVVVGCGNIYCDEVCWASAVLPTRPSRSLKEKEVELIYKNIKKILDKAINSGGSSVANYLLADGKRGNYADYHNVYKKENTPCKFKIGNKKCSGIIKKITFAGRGTHFCPVHQK
jgi:formamidopyrimidine-DNA glycosylase